MSERSRQRSEEIVVDRPHELSIDGKDMPVLRAQIDEGFGEGRRVVYSRVVLASSFSPTNQHRGWEAILQAMIDAGWIITGSWPIDTEMGSASARAGFSRARLLRPSRLPPAREPGRLRPHR